jgi:hypothetical protein
MVPVMRRKIAMIAVLGGLAAGLGCHHIAGKADCGYNPANYPIAPPTPPAPSYPVLGAAPVVPKDPVIIPKSKNGGSDKDVRGKTGMGDEGGY